MRLDPSVRLVKDSITFSMTPENRTFTLKQLDEVRNQLIFQEIDAAIDTYFL